MNYKKEREGDNYNTEVLSLEGWKNEFSFLEMGKLQ